MCKERVEMLGFNLKALPRVRGNLPQMFSKTCPMFLEGGHHKTLKSDFAFWRPEDEPGFDSPAAAERVASSGIMVMVLEIVVAAGRW